MVVSAAGRGLGVDRAAPAQRQGRPRVDDRRVISGIPHILKTGGRWRDVPEAYGPATTIYNRWSRRGIWGRLFEKTVASGDVPAELMLGSTHVKAHRSAAGAKGGVGTGGRRLARRADDEDPSLASDCGRPVALALTPGNMAAIIMAMPLLEAVAPPKRLNSDRAYDAMRLRDRLKAHRIKVVIPATATRFNPFPLDRRAYKRRNRIERLFCRLENWRRIATRYDQLARNYMASLALVSVVISWT